MCCIHVTHHTHDMVLVIPDEFHQQFRRYHPALLAGYRSPAPRAGGRRRLRGHRGQRRGHRGRVGHVAAVRRSRGAARNWDSGHNGVFSRLATPPLDQEAEHNVRRSVGRRGRDVNPLQLGRVEALGRGRETRCHIMQAVDTKIDCTGSFIGR